MTATWTYKKPIKEIFVCPNCNGLLPIGKHRGRPRCTRCGGRGWVNEVRPREQDYVGTAVTIRAGNGYR